MRTRKVAIAALIALLGTTFATVQAAPSKNPEAIYFVVLDRFNNGDTSNDTGGLTGSNSVTGFDLTDHGYFHGGDIVGLDQKLDYIKGMGFTTVWLTPIVVQQTVQGDSGSYHGYWGLDFTKIDPHFGTSEQFTKLVNDAHSMGMKVVLDIVVNHTADVIKYDSSGKAFIPAGAPTKSPAWLNDLSNYHNVGNMGTSSATNITGDFYGLDDIKTESPVVQADWTALWSEWIAKYHFDGFRIDTVQHVDAGFWNYFLPKIQAAAKKAGVSDFQIFGEIADTDPTFISTFITEQSYPSALDFPFRQGVLDFVTTSAKASRLADVFNGDDYYSTATTDASAMRTFISNHDAGRIGYFINTRDSWDDTASNLKRNLLAQDLLYLLRGVPVGYYGDEVGMAGVSGDKDARQDMFPTQVANWQSEKRFGSDPIGTQSSFGQNNPVKDEITKLLALRKSYPALAFAPQETIYADGNVIAFSRVAGKNEFIEIFNSGTQDADLSINHSKSSWEQLLGSGTINAGDSALKVSIPAESSILLRNTAPYSDSSKPSITLLQPQVANAVAWIPLIAKSAGNAANTVTFSYSTDKKKWISVGTSNHRTFATDNTDGGLYRVFLHPKSVKAKKIYVRAILTNSSGATATGKILQVTLA